MLNTSRSLTLVAATSLLIAAAMPSHAGSSSRTSSCSTSSSSSGPTICETEITWDFRSNSSEFDYQGTTSGVSSYGSTSSSTEAMDVGIKAWSIDNGAYNTTSLFSNNYGLNIGSHAVNSDYANNYFEYIVLDFEEPVSLLCYSFGWVGSDYDSSVWSNAGSGWSLLSHYKDSDTSGSGATRVVDTSGDTSTVYASRWAIGALAPTSIDSINDAFKIASISVGKLTTPGKPSTPPGSVPVPAPAALIALGALFLLRKKR